MNFCVAFNPIFGQQSVPRFLRREKNENKRMLGLAIRHFLTKKYRQLYHIMASLTERWTAFCPVSSPAQVSHKLEHFLQPMSMPTVCQIAKEYDS